VLHATLDGLQTELARESPSLSRISRIVEQDIAAAAKLLQIVNSAFFGSHGAVCHAERAVHLLGADLLRGLVLSSGLMVEMDEDVARRLDGDGTPLGPGGGRAMLCAGIGRVVLACCGLDEPGMVACTPAQAGTYLLTLWGLPEEIMAVTRSEEL
jgi:HD-like signal output (HDOD) protein